MSEMTQRIDRGKLVGGVILIALGVVFLLDRIGVAEFGDVFRRYWPMVLVLIGLPRIFKRETLWSGLWMITLGAWLQMVRLHLFGLTFRTSWPLLLIALGAGIIIRTFIESAIPEEGENENAP